MTRLLILCLLIAGCSDDRNRPGSPTENGALPTISIVAPPTDTTMSAVDLEASGVVVHVQSSNVDAVMRIWAHTSRRLTPYHDETFATSEVGNALALRIQAPEGWIDGAVFTQIIGELRDGETTMLLAADSILVNLE